MELLATWDITVLVLLAELSHAPVIDASKTLGSVCPAATSKGTTWNITIFVLLAELSHALVIEASLTRGSVLSAAKLLIVVTGANLRRKEQQAEEQAEEPHEEKLFGPQHRQRACSGLGRVGSLSVPCRLLSSSLSGRDGSLRF